MMGLPRRSPSNWRLGRCWGGRDGAADGGAPAALKDDVTTPAAARSADSGRWRMDGSVARWRGGGARGPPGRGTGPAAGLSPSGPRWLAHQQVGGSLPAGKNYREAGGRPDRGAVRLLRVNVGPVPRPRARPRFVEAASAQDLEVARRGSLMRRTVEPEPVVAPLQTLPAMSATP